MSGTRSDFESFKTLSLPQWSFNGPWNMVLLLGPWMKSLSVAIQMEATEQYFSVALFITLYKVVLTSQRWEWNPLVWHSNESYWAVHCCGSVYYAVQSDSNFWICEKKNPTVWPFKWKLLSNTFLWYCLLCYTGNFNFSVWMKSHSVTSIQTKAVTFQW